jgi:hypothetical protein
MDMVTTDASKARPQGIASSARGRKSARIQGILAHGPAVHVAPNVVDQEQDELGVDAEDEPSQSTIQSPTQNVGFYMAFSDFWGAKLKDSLVFRLRIMKIHLPMHQFLCAPITKTILRATYMARRGALSVWPVFALLWLDALMDVATTLLSVVRPDVSVAISSLMLAVLFRNMFCLQLGSSSKSIGTSVLLARRRYVL